MTKEASELDWKTLFEERGYDAEPVEGPVGRDEDGQQALEWFQVLTRFTQRGFMRVIVAEAEPNLKVELQVALPDGEGSGYLTALRRHLEGRGFDVDVVSEKRPWTLDLVLDSNDRLAELVDDLETLSSHVRRAEESGDIGALVSDWSTGADTANRDDAADDTTESAEPSAQASAGPFESIGDDQPNEDATPPTTEHGESEDSNERESPQRDEPASKQARLGPFRLRVDDGAISLRASPEREASTAALERLARSLRSKLENRFDLVSRASDVQDDAIELRMEPSDLGATYGMPLGELCDDIANYLDRQRELAELGVSLDKLSPRSDSAGRETSESTRSPTTRDTIRRDEPRREPRAEVEEDDGGVVFGFGEEDLTAASPSESSLRAGDYTDARVMREDADTALVDVVLRHPGYSDRNMRQVLSILLDVDYYRAGKLIDQAPCVIAWGVSQERAREFKRVIERSGGRVTLVEPDSLADAE